MVGVRNTRACSSDVSHQLVSGWVVDVSAREPAQLRCAKSPGARDLDLVFRTARKSDCRVSRWYHTAAKQAFCDVMNRH